MNKKLKLGLIALLVLIVVGLAIGFGLSKRNQGNIEYTGYFIQYDGTWDRDTKDYIFFIDDVEEQWLYYEDTRTFTKVTAEIPFVLQLRTLKGYFFQFPQYNYEPISNHTIYDLYYDEFGNYFIKATEITGYELQPTYIIGGEHDNQTT